MTITLPNSRWKLIGGLPVLAEGDCCVTPMLFYENARSDLYVNGEFFKHDTCSKYNPFSSEHFSAAEKLLDDYLAKKREESVKEVFRSEHITVYRRGDGAEASVFFDGKDCYPWSCTCSTGPAVRPVHDTREKAEAAAKQALMEGK